VLASASGTKKEKRRRRRLKPVCFLRVEGVTRRRRQSESKIAWGEKEEKLSLTAKREGGGVRNLIFITADIHGCISADGDGQNGGKGKMKYEEEGINTTGIRVMNEGCFGSFGAQAGGGRCWERKGGEKGRNVYNQRFR